ncbi:hypothetical protein [Patiriisocius sp. Uisw_017]|jgi:hypothetical protein|uniref:hypothetical protein n=1 Tax=Patiriisocius sp. Uisw_017 TaxID=3230968 RepID=UPI0039EABA33
MYFDSSNSNFEDAIISGSVKDSLATSLWNTMKELPYQETVSLQTAFIKNNPNSIFSAHNLSIIASVFGQEETKKLFDKFSIKNKQSSHGIIVAEFLEIKISKTPKIVEKYVDFSMGNRSGELDKLSNYSGKYILLEFWAS